MLMAIGLILLLLGGGGAVLFIIQIQPALFAGTPITLSSCVAVAVIGLVIIIMNRRPAN